MYLYVNIPKPKKEYYPKIMKKEIVTEIIDGLPMLVEKRTTLKAYPKIKQITKELKAKMKEDLNNLKKNIQETVSSLKDKKEISIITGTLGKQTRLGYLFRCRKCRNNWYSAEEKDGDKCPKCGEKITEPYPRGIWKQIIANYEFEDITGKCIIELWNNDANIYREGDTITINNGWSYFRSYEDTNDLENGKPKIKYEMKLGKGKYGSIEKET